MVIISYIEIMILILSLKIQQLQRIVMSCIDETCRHISMEMHRKLQCKVSEGFAITV